MSDADVETALRGRDTVCGRELLCLALHAATGRPTDVFREMLIEYERVTGRPMVQSREVPVAEAATIISHARLAPGELFSRLGLPADLLDYPPELLEQIRPKLPAEMEAAIRRAESRALLRPKRRLRLPSDEELIAEGMIYWQISYARARDDKAAWLAAWDSTLEQAKRGDIENARVVQCAMGDPSQGHQMFALARWVDQACPVIRLHGHKYAAALMATNPGVDGAALQAPWRAWMVHVPNGLLTTDRDGQRGSVTRLLVHVHDVDLDRTGGLIEVWSVLALADNGVVLSSTKNRAHELIKNARAFDDTLALAVSHDDQDERVLTLACRLALNSAIELSERRGSSGPGQPGKKPTKNSPPTLRFFKIGRPVDVDCRSAIDDYISGSRRKSPSVQWLVRGHWKSQAFGPSSLGRRTVWIKPYWNRKGRENAPIARRPHRLRPSRGTE